MDIKDYLFKLKELETFLYEQNSLWWNLKNQSDSLQQNKRILPKESYMHEDGFSMASGGCVYVVTIPLSAYLIICGLIGLTEVPLLCMGAILVGIILIFAPPVIVHIKNKKDVEKANNEIYHRNNRIEENNKREEERVRTQVDIIDREMKIISKNYYDAKNTLDKLYARNIIFPKYRALIPICAFYEYFISGRCSSLQGHEGAYNIYENELRQNIIIGKLDTVISRLDDIKNNQYVLYESLNSCNSRIQTISQQVVGMSQNMRSIESNSQITAYNSEIAARNSEFLKWVEIIEQ